MFEKFGSSIKRALLFSRCEAAHMGSSSIDPEVILLGILDERDPVLLGCLEQLGQTTASFRSGIERIWREKHSSLVAADPGGKMPLSREAQKILALASHYANSDRHHVVKPGHMLWAIADVVPELLERLFGQVPEWVESESDNDYLELPDRFEVPLDSLPDFAQAAAGKLHTLVEELERAFGERRFADVLLMNERIEALRAELIPPRGPRGA